MAMGETLVTVVGNVLSDLSRRTVGTGHEVVNFWLRSNERRFDKSTGEWVDGRHFSVKVTCWRRLAEQAHTSLRKGDPVLVLGRLSSNEFEVDGKNRSSPELEALALGPNLSFCTAVVQRVRRQTATTVPEQVPREPAGGGADEGAEPVAAAALG
jgi:single-strand DNA-binding protein